MEEKKTRTEQDNSYESFSVDEAVPYTTEEIEQDKIQQLLSNLKPGNQIMVIRSQPSWCRGHLETYEYYGDEDEPIDLGYLIRTWGGQRLRIRITGDRGRIIGGASVALYSYPPKVRGKIITESDTISDNSQNRQTSNTVQYLPNPYQSNQIDLSKILDILSKQKGSDVASTLKILEFLQSRSAQPYQPQIQNPIEQMLQLATAFKQMRDIFGDFGGPSDHDGDNLLPLAGDLVKTLLGKQQQPLPPSRGALAPPISQPLHQPKQVEKNPEKDNILTLATKLSGLNAEDAAGVALLALESMDDRKKQQFMETIQSELFGVDEMDEMDDPKENADR